MKGNVVQHIIPLVAEIDWKKGNMIHNSLSLEEALVGERGAVRRGKKVSVLTPTHFSTLYGLAHSIP